MAAQDGLIQFNTDILKVDHTYQITVIGWVLALYNVIYDFLTLFVLP